MMIRQADNRKQALLAALRESRGIVSVACSCVGVPRRTFYNWLDTDPEFLRAVEDVNEDAVDYVEGKLLERIESGSERSIIFFLKTRGRSRGYRENGENEMLNRDFVKLLGSNFSSNRALYDDLLSDPADFISPSDIP